jgi:cytochrome c biogenesis protein CcmG, thiol:disulfide interchange protein DsbE
VRFFLLLQVKGPWYNREKMPSSGNRRQLLTNPFEEEIYLRKPITILTTIVILFSLALYLNKNSQHVGPTNQKADVSNQQGSAPSADEAASVGAHAPSFELTALDNKSYSLKSLQGKPVVLNFWASWCGPCKLEAPELVRIYEKYQEKVNVYAIDLTKNDSIPDAQAFAQKNKYTFPVLLDKEGAVADKYQVQAIPTSYFVNKDGVIVDKVLGLVDPKTLDEKFKKLLSNE